MVVDFGIEGAHSVMSDLHRGGGQLLARAQAVDVSTMLFLCCDRHIPVCPSVDRECIAIQAVVGGSMP